jgi:hypothetical protein
MPTGFFTSFKEDNDHCMWNNCPKPKIKGSFCEEHGRIKIKVLIVKNRKNDNLEPVRFKGKTFKQK